MFKKFITASLALTLISPTVPIPGRQPVYCRKKQVASFLPSNLNLPTAPLITAVFLPRASEKYAAATNRL